MARMLDVLEIFLNYHGYTYLRLDGATPIIKRQVHCCILDYMYNLWACVFYMCMFCKWFYDATLGCMKISSDGCVLNLCSNASLKFIVHHCCMYSTCYLVSK